MASPDLTSAAETPCSSSARRGPTEPQRQSIAQDFQPGDGCILAPRRRHSEHRRLPGAQPQRGWKLRNPARSPGFRPTRRPRGPRSQLAVEWKKAWMRTIALPRTHRRYMGEAEGGRVAIVEPTGGHAVSGRQGFPPPPGPRVPRLEPAAPVSRSRHPRRGDHSVMFGKRHDDGTETYSAMELVRLAFPAACTPKAIRLPRKPSANSNRGPKLRA